MRTRASLLLVLLLLLGYTVTAAAQAGGEAVTVTAEAGLGGHFKFGEWLPVWVELANAGAGRTVEVQVRVVGTWGGTTFARTVSLPSGSRKRAPVYVLPNNYSRALEVKVVEGSEALAERTVQVRSHLNTDYVVVVVAAERGALALASNAGLQGVDRKVVLVDLTLEGLPDQAEGLGSVDCLILNDVDTSSLAPEQRGALDRWVRQGGRLVLGGGAGAARVASGLPADLLALRPERLVELAELAGLEEFVAGQPVRVPGPFVTAVGEVVGGQTLATEEGVALVQERRVGRGYVDAVALDLAGSPFDAWAGAVPFWGKLILTGAAYARDLPPDLSERQMVSGQMSYALSSLPSLTLPSVKWLAAVLGAYIMLVGPANYLVLRWRGRLQWAWATIPAITALFSAGAFGLGYALRGTDLILNKVAVVTLHGDGTARANTYMGLFSPAQRSYEIEVDGGGLLSPLNPDADPFAASGSGGRSETVFLQGTPARVRGLAVNQWSMQTFMSEEVWAQAGRIEAEIELVGEELVGTVRNMTARDLTDVVFVLGTQFVRLGDLERGDEASVRLDVSKRMEGAFGPPLGYRLFEEQLLQAGPAGPPREVQFKQTVLDSVFSVGGKSSFSSLSRLGMVAPGGGASGPYVLGWFGEAPPEVLVGGRKPAVQTMGLLMAPVEYRLAGGEETIIPPGLIPGTVIAMPAEGGMCGQAGSTAVYVGRGEAAFEFQVPPGMAAAPRRLIVEVGSDGGWAAAPELAVYSWDEAEWVAVADPVLGRNVLEAAGLVSADGAVRVQLSSDGTRSGCYYVDLGLEGGR